MILPCVAVVSGTNAGALVGGQDGKSTATLYTDPAYPGDLYDYVTVRTGRRDPSASDIEFARLAGDLEHGVIDIETTHAAQRHFNLN